MKKLIFILLIIHCQLSIVHCQNVGIGTAIPVNKLQVAGNLLVNEALTGTATPVRSRRTFRKL